MRPSKYASNRRSLSAVVLAAAVALLGLPTAGSAGSAGDTLLADGFEARAPAAMALISRQQPTAASSGNATAVVDGTYFGWATWDALPTPQAPAWVAIRTRIGSARAMLNWVAFPGSNPPASYRIETSADSTNGSDGQWTTALTVSGNGEQARAHSFAAGGRRWLRFVVTAALNPQQPISINEIDVHDASQGSSDSWIFLGDSISAAAFSRGSGDGNFPERVHAQVPTHFPLMIGAGIGGTSTFDGVTHIDAWIATHAELQHWVVSYGTNDSANGDPLDAPNFGARLRVIVGRLRAAGKSVYLPRIPYKTGGEAYLAPYNAQIDAVSAEYGLLPGPDLYAWFFAHPEQLADGVHPTEDGSRAINRLWAEAVRSLYP